MVTKENGKIRFPSLRSGVDCPVPKAWTRQGETEETGLPCGEAGEAVVLIKRRCWGKEHRGALLLLSEATAQLGTLVAKIPLVIEESPSKLTFLSEKQAKLPMEIMLRAGCRGVGEAGYRVQCECGRPWVQPQYPQLKSARTSQRIGRHSPPGVKQWVESGSSALLEFLCVYLPVQQGFCFGTRDQTCKAATYAAELNHWPIKPEIFVTVS